ncbi:hypothetical protein H8E07_04025 [bacterium]|nr:hypothetical protein [bacterium]
MPRRRLFVIILLPVLLPGDALAYLDPGSGSFVFQILISALLGAAVVLKTSWRRIRDFFTRKDRTDEEA